MNIYIVENNYFYPRFTRFIRISSFTTFFCNFISTPHLKPCILAFQTKHISKSTIGKKITTKIEKLVRQDQQRFSKWISYLNMYWYIYQINVDFKYHTKYIWTKKTIWYVVLIDFLWKILQKKKLANNTSNLVRNM